MDEKLHYVISYDIHDEEVRKNFHTQLLQAYGTCQIGESVYGIISVNRDTLFKKFKEHVTKLLKLAYSDKQRDDNDKIFILCNSLQADDNADNSDKHKIYAYQI